MLPFVVVGLVAVLAILAWRGGQADRARVKAKLRKATAPKPQAAPKPGRTGAPQTLERDPETGVYKLRDD